MLRDGWWIYHPQAGPQPEIILAASGSTEGGWQLCHQSGCLTLGAESSAPVRVGLCDSNGQ
jgi:hypothetical protein